MQIAVLQILHLLLTSSDVGGLQTHWDIMVTGHSLGGALSSICGYELARMRQEKPETSQCDLRGVLQYTSIFLIILLCTPPLLISTKPNLT